MTDSDQEIQKKKKAMQQLRQKRKKSIRKIAAMVKVQKKDLKGIRELVAGDGATAPEVAASLAMDVSRAIWYLATLKQYGEVVEGAKDGGYFRYKLVAKKDENAA